MKTLWRIVRGLLFLVVGFYGTFWVALLVNVLLDKTGLGRQDRSGPGAGWLLRPPGVFVGIAFGLCCIWMVLRTARRPESDEDSTEKDK